jgi:hypothetical protein
MKAGKANNGVICNINESENNGESWPAGSCGGYHGGWLKRSENNGNVINNNNNENISESQRILQPAKASESWRSESWRWRLSAAAKAGVMAA